MANVAVFEPGKLPVYLTSVHTPIYSANPYALINPDLSAVKEVATRYWKRIGDKVTEMTQSEKDDLDAVLLQEQKDKMTLDASVTALIRAGNRVWSEAIKKEDVLNELKMG